MKKLFILTAVILTGCSCKCREEPKINPQKSLITPPNYNVRPPKTNKSENKSSAEKNETEIKTKVKE